MSERIQKHLSPADVGTGRSARIGLPSPKLRGPAGGAFERVCGALVLPGWLTRPATIPLLTIITVAIVTTNVPILLKDGFWKLAREAWTDLSMLLGCLVLLWLGAGAWSVDGRLGRNTFNPKGSQ